MFPSPAMVKGSVERILIRDEKETSMAVEDDVIRAAASLEDVVAFPLRTIDASGDGLATTSSTRGGETGSVTRTAQQTIREVLGWRYRDNDVKGFLAALSKSF